MSEQQQILSIIDNLGGRENIKDYYHCATRLRFNLFDYDKINKDALKANPLVLSVVQASGQCQLIIGNKVGAVYSALHGVLETGGQNSAPSYAIGGMSAIAQMGVALGILIRTRDTGTRQLASSAFFPSLISGVTEPILYGLIIPNRRTIYYIIIAGAVGGGIVGGYNITINNLVFASLLSIPTASNMLIYSVGLFATLITGAVLPVIFGYKSRF
ncbi:TPA: PTS transporter subunit EIIB [Klebsiella pneumoniae]